MELQFVGSAFFGCMLAVGVVGRFDFFDFKFGTEPRYSLAVGRYFMVGLHWVLLSPLI
jgi:hypothetical protein